MAKFYCPGKLSENISKTPEGYLLCVGVPIARTGVMEYGEGEIPLEAGDDGIIYVSRDSSDIFNKLTMASFEGKSVTVRHPENFVTPRNWKMVTNGTMHNVRKADERDEDGEEVLVADLLITDDFTISLVEGGLREVSCGYEAQYKQTGKGRGRQTDIVGNHIALVEAGRAGPSYAINDEKRKVTMPNIMKKFKVLFGKTVDEAIAEKEKAAKVTKDAKIVERTKLLKTIKDTEAALAKLTKDSKTPKKVVKKAKTSDEAAEVTTMDAESYDELKEMCDALGAKLEAMKPKSEDADEEEESEDESEEESEDEDESEEESESEDDDGEELMERVKALEAALAQLMESQDADGDDDESEDDDGDMDETDDADEDDEKDLKGGKKTGDAALIEIIAPGLKVPKDGNGKVLALKAAYKTTDGKKVIQQLTGGYKPRFDSKREVAALFAGTAEILKLKRGVGLDGTKKVTTDADGKPSKTFSEFDSTKEEMTPEKMNELNAAHFAAKK